MASENNINNSVWDYDSLKKVYKTLKNKERTDIEEKEFLLLERILNGASIDGISFVDNISFKDAYAHETYTVLIDYYKYLYVIFKFHDINDEDRELIPYEKLNTNPDILKQTAGDFFKSLNEEWFKLFLNISSPENSSVSYSSLRSFSTYFPSSNYWLANIYKHDTIQDYVDTIHEYAHGIADQLSSETKTYTSNNIFIELFPITCQMIWLYECDESGLQHELTKYISNYFKIMTDYAEEIRFKYNICSTFYSVKSSKVLAKLIKKEWNIIITPKELEGYYEYPVQELFSYVYPFLVSLELLEIYKKDKNEFINIMNDLIVSKKDPLEILSAYNIEPAKSLNKK